MELRTGGCTLRRLRPGDAASLARHADNRKIRLNLRDLFPHPYELADAESFISRAAAEDPLVTFAIDVSGEAVGCIGLRLGTDVERYSAEVGYRLGEEYWRRGITTGALRVITAYAFEELGLLRVFAVPFAHNAASAAVPERPATDWRGPCGRVRSRAGGFSTSSSTPRSATRPDHRPACRRPLDDPGVDSASPRPVSAPSPS